MPAGDTIRAPVLVTAPPPPGPTLRRSDLLPWACPEFPGPAARNHWPDDARPPRRSDQAPPGPCRLSPGSSPASLASSSSFAAGLAGSTATPATSPGVSHPWLCRLRRPSPRRPLDVAGPDMLHLLLRRVAPQWLVQPPLPRPRYGHVNPPGLVGPSRFIYLPPRP
ncbi:hypothetical protein MTO96_034296 [Rhipicephalus appendiculatus]